MEESQLLEQLRADAAARAPGWAVTANITHAADGPVFNVEMEHPASHGLIFSIGGKGRTEDPRGWLSRALEGSEEIDIVGAAPALEHAQLVLGVRTLIQAFGWSSTEVRGLAFVLHEADALTEDAAAWLAGYCGVDAPMSRQSPLGP